MYVPGRCQEAADMLSRVKLPVSLQILQVHEVINDVEEAQLVKQLGANLEFMQLRDKSAVIGSIGRRFCKPDVMIVRGRN